MRFSTIAVINFAMSCALEQELEEELILHCGKNIYRGYTIREAFISAMVELDLSEIKLCTT